MSRKFNILLSASGHRRLAELAGWLSKTMADATMADAIREAISIYWLFARERRAGHFMWVERPDGSRADVLLPLVEMALGDPAWSER